MIISSFGATVALSLAQTAATPAALEPSIRDLSVLIGEWEFEDRSTAALGFDYVETGTRSCGYALDNSYIRCTSTGMSRGKQRTYEFSFNYNRLDKRFEMVALHGDYGPKSVYNVTVSENGKRIDLVVNRGCRGDPPVCSSNWGTIRVVDANTMTWETRRNRSTDQPDTWPVITIDTARRK
jgi:hypothetical protein